MQIHTISAHPTSRTPRRIGRGGKRGTYSGRGIKGLGARAGGKFRPAERDTLKKIPKLRGYRFKSFRPKPAVINLERVEAAFHDGDVVSPATLVAMGLVRKAGGRIPAVKILGTGETKKNLVFTQVLFSRSAGQKIALSKASR